MAVALTDKEIFLQELKTMECGEKAELETKLKSRGLSQDVINETYKELNLVSVIQQGYDGLGKLRYKITSFGNDYCDVFSSFDSIKQELVAIKASVQNAL